MAEFADLVKRLITEGQNPNDLLEQFTASVEETGVWALWGDMQWRENNVCSKCGSAYGGICADKGAKVSMTDFGNPAFHKNQPGVTMIPWNKWKGAGGPQ